MKVLITGSKGQLGRALIKLKPSNTEIYAMDRNNFDFLDITSCLKTINLINPDWIINSAAFTNVDMAESQKETVMKVNYEAPKAFALEITFSSRSFRMTSILLLMDIMKQIIFNMIFL